jgi:hypothetical protein
MLQCATLKEGPRRLFKAEMLKQSSRSLCGEQKEVESSLLRDQSNILKREGRDNPCPLLLTLPLKLVEDMMYFTAIVLAGGIVKTQ